MASFGTGQHKAPCQIIKSSSHPFHGLPRSRIPSYARYPATTTAITLAHIGIEVFSMTIDAPKAIHSTSAREMSRKSTPATQRKCLLVHTNLHTFPAVVYTPRGRLLHRTRHMPFDVFNKQIAEWPPQTFLHYGTGIRELYIRARRGIEF
jgi:hypothetical protein